MFNSNTLNNAKTNSTAPMSLDMFEMGFTAKQQTNEIISNNEDTEQVEIKNEARGDEEPQSNEGEYVPPFIPM